MKERRRDVRIAEENRVIIDMRGQEDDKELKTFSALTQDLSLGGVKVVADNPLEENKDLSMTIILSKSRQIIKVHGRIRWVHEVESGLFEAGIQFQHDIPANIMTLINHLFRKKTFVFDNSGSKP